MPGEAAFSDLLREQRRTAGYSQEELAERAGLSVGAVAALEQGARRAPYRDTVSALAKALGFSDSVKREFEEAAARARRRVRRDDAVLPIAMTTFIARNEVEELTALLADHRLVTITGPGGVGKTRIAIEVARRSDQFFDQTIFIDLLPVRDGAMVAPYLAARLHVQAESNDFSGIVRFLQQRRALLVIDNCEHVIADAADLIGNLVRRCPSLTVLATSREPLALSMELAYRLPSMNVAAASALFVARAQTVDPTLTMDPQRLAVVADICRKLDGIPLAIELAASQVSTLGFEELRKRLQSGLALPGSRDLPPRHQTMDATISWSFGLLNDEQRPAFRRLSVFAGGFTLEAAEMVCGNVAEQVAHLVQKSLINVEHIGTSTRYVFLDSIRAYAWNRLSESGELRTTMRRFMDWLASRTLFVDSTEFHEQIFEHRIELDNVAAAVIWAESTGDRETILTAANLLIGFRFVWDAANRQLELRTLTRGLVEHVSSDENPEIVGRLLYLLSAHVSNAELVALGAQTIELLTATGQDARAANIHARLAQMEAVAGNESAAKNHLANVARLLSERELRATSDGLVATSTSAYACLVLGDYAGARRLLTSADIPLGNPFEVEFVVVGAEIDFREGRAEKAIELLKVVADNVATYFSANHLAAMVFGNLAMYELHLGDELWAERHLRKSLRALIESQDLARLSIAVEYARFAAALAALSGRFELAARLLGSSDATSKQSGSSFTDSFAYDLATAAIEKNVSQAEARALRSRGASEDLFDLFEEFLAHPAAAESALPSSTSSDRPTSVMRSSPN